MCHILIITIYVYNVFLPFTKHLVTIAHRYSRGNSLYMYIEHILFASEKTEIFSI